MKQTQIMQRNDNGVIKKAVWYAITALKPVNKILRSFLSFSYNFLINWLRISLTKIPIQKLYFIDENSWYYHDDTKRQISIAMELMVSLTEVKSEL